MLIVEGLSGLPDLEPPKNARVRARQHEHIFHTLVDLLPSTIHYASSEL
jgi:hypothetical protein